MQKKSEEGKPLVLTKIALCKYHGSKMKPELTGVNQVKGSCSLI